MVQKKHHCESILLGRNNVDFVSKMKIYLGTLVLQDVDLLPR